MANVLVEETSLSNIANAIRNKNGTAAKYKPSEMANAISQITTSEDLTSELTEQNTLITTQETTIDDIVSALQGKSAGGGVEIKLQEKTITPTTSQQNVIADNGYTGLSKVVVNKVTSSIDSNIKASNIKNGVSILGVTGTLKEGITPSGTLEITANGTHNVTNYANVNVNVASSGGSDNSREEGLVARTLTEYSNDTVTSIGGNAFYNYSGLKSVNLPNVISIGEYAFYYCDKLLILDFPKVTSIAHRAFRNCSSLKTFILRSETVCTIGASAFQSTPIASGTGYIYVPDNLVDSYKTATNWSTYASQIKGVSEL